MDKKLKEMIITIVGVGQIGGSFALALRKNKIGKKIIGVDKEEVIVRYKINEIVDFPTVNLESAIQEADFIFLSTPILTILKLLPQIIFYMKPETILLDSGSTKKVISLLMKKYPDRILIGGHPMTGTEKAGLEAACPSLFQNEIFALNFPTQGSLIGKKTVLKIIEKIGAIPLEIEAERHDFIVSLTSHLPYILSLSLSLLAEDYFGKNPLFKKFIASGFFGATRLSLTHEEMGRGILKTNSNNIIQKIDEFIGRLERVKSLIEKKRDEELMDCLFKIRGFQSKINKEYEASH